MRRLAFFFLFLVSGIWLLQAWFLPGYLENHLIPQLAADAGWPNFSCRVRHVGFTGLEMGPLELKQGGDPALRVGSVFISYSPLSLLRQHLTDVQVTGVTLFISSRQEGFVFAGQPLVSEKSAETDVQAKTEKDELTLPVSFRRVICSNAEVIYEDNNGIFRIPFGLEVESFEKSGMHVVADVQIAEKKINFDGVVDLLDREVRAEVRSDEIPLQRLAAWGGFPCQGVPAGTAEINADLFFHFKPFAVQEAQAEVRFHRMGWEGENFSIAQSGPLVLRAAWQEKNRMSLQISATHFAGNVSGRIAMDPLTVDFSETETRLHGFWSLALEQLLYENWAVVLEKELVLSGEIDAAIHPQKGWNATLKTQRGTDGVGQSADLGLRGEKAELWLGENRLSCHAKGKNNQAELDLELQLKALKGVLPQGSFRLDSLQGQGHLAYKPGEASSLPLSLRGGVSAQVKDVKLSHDSLEIHAPRLTAFADWLPRAADAGIWQGNIAFDRGRVRDFRQGLSAEDITLSLPWQFPVADQIAPGVLRIGRVRHQKQDLGGLKADLQQKQEGWFWNGYWRRFLQSSKALRFKGDSDLIFSRAAMRFSFAQASFSPEELVKAYFPELEGLNIKTDIHLKGELLWREGLLSCPVRFMLDNLEFSDVKKKLEAKGAALDLQFSNLLDLGTIRAQQLSFDQVRVSGATFENGRIDFLVDSDLQLLFEKMTFDWCGGQVHSEAFRIHPGLDRIDVVLYCDRVNLALLLEQLGAAQAEGTGSLSGRIPVCYAEGKFSVTDGFLFSTPGEGGMLHVSGMENLTAGLPGDNAYTGQLKLAEAALRDYEYEWARLGINSEADDLMVSVQLDGRPAKPLPFVYRKEFGGFVRAEANFPGSRFEGIRLDLNFRFPLNQLLEYRDLLKFMN